MLEYGRKPYITKNYREMMNTTPNRTVWNKLIEKHSEFEKPYLRGTNYDKMQFFHHIMPGLSPWKFDFDFGGWDFPFNPYDPGSYIPWTLVFGCFGDPCWCPGETICFDMGCTMPMVGIEPTGSQGCEGISFNIENGLLCIESGEDPGWDCNLNITMQVPPNKSGLPAGYIGEHGNISIRECSECEEVEPVSWDYDNSAETIVPEDGVSIFALDGCAPFTWEVTGTGFTLDQETTTTGENVLYGDADSCGSAIVTVTDCNDNEVVAAVRSTVGTWVMKVLDTGSFTPVNCNVADIADKAYYTVTQDNTRTESQTWRFCCTNEGATPIPAGGCRTTSPVIQCSSGSWYSHDVCWVYREDEWEC